MTNILFEGLLQDADPTAKFAIIPAVDQTAKERWYSYQDVLDVTARIANVLSAMKVNPGDRVAAQVPKSAEALMLYLATVRMGAVFLPLNNAYTPNEIEYFLKDATPTIFICAPKDASIYRPLCDALTIRLETLGLWQNHETSAGTIADLGLQADTSFKPVARADVDLAAILYTSGTTGRSKGAMLTHKNLLSNAETLAKYWQFTKEDVLLHALPIFHTHGLFVATNVILKSGGSMIFLPAFNTDHIIKLLPRATSFMGVPTFYTRLLSDKRFDRSITSHMRLFVSGSAPLLADTHRAFEDRTGHKILERYGMTETNMNTSNPYDGDRIAGTVGLPLPSISVRISHGKNGKELPDGEIGILEVKGPNVFAGYWQMPEKTKQEFRPDGYFITGDMAAKDEKGYITIVGRNKDLIISGGYNIYPKELELFFDAQSGVLESAIVGVPHPDFGEAVIAVLVPDNKSRLHLQEIRAKMADQIAKFKRPKEIIILDQLPRNTMGKVQKNILRQNYSKLFQLR